MDINHDAQPPLAATFPLPFRVLFLGGMGILAWATNLHGLDLLGVDPIAALDLRPYEENRLRSATLFNLPPGNASRHYYPIYKLFRSYSIWCICAWLCFRYATRGQLDLVDVFRYLAAVCGLVVMIGVVCPSDTFQRRERDIFLLSIRRCLFASNDAPVYFADVVFADIFTSFAKVLGDVWLSTCMLLPGNSLLALPAQEGWARWILPFIMSLPYLVRLRQCVIEYTQAPNGRQNERRRHLMNALKYASAFPVIFLSAAQRIVVMDLTQAKGPEAAQATWHGEHPLFRLWLLTAAVNAIYSFWWDLTQDWGLDLLKPGTSKIQRETYFSPTLPTPNKATSLPNLAHCNGTAHHHKSHPFGLRRKLLYPLPVYPLIIFLNFILRMTWSVKLSSHLHSSAEGSELIFWLEMAELVRRWLWVFIRVEWEVVKRVEQGTWKQEPNGEIELIFSKPDSPNQDDV